MSDIFEIYDITAIASILEQLGTKEKFWFKGYWDNLEEDWLFKFSRDNTGEHWSEKAAEQLCLILEIPHAEYHLAKSKERIGVITKNLVPEGYSMIMGNQLLYTMNPSAYPEPEINEEAFMHTKEHTLDSIFQAFRGNDVLPPENLQNYNMLEGIDAAGVFSGYLMLDVLISNQDRHHENWAILETTDGKYHLSPTFDHAASLGRELLDEEREERLLSKDKYRQVAHFVSRAKSEIFNSSSLQKPMSTIDAFYESVKERVEVKDIWLSKLDVLSKEEIISIFERIPDEVITPKAREFSVEMILANKRRLLEDERS